MLRDPIIGIFHVLVWESFDEMYRAEVTSDRITKLILRGKAFGDMELDRIIFSHCRLALG
jgi:hypothetical protein